MEWTSIFWFARDTRVQYASVTIFPMQASALLPLNLERLLAQVRTVVEDVIAPDAERVDQEANWPEAGIRALQAAGLGGLVVPQQYGGLGFGLFGLIRVCEEISKACPSTALCFGMHCVGSAVISAKATADHHARYLEPINRGEHLTTLALSEPGTGSHFYFPQAELKRDTFGGYHLRGQKSFVTNGGHADSYVVSTVAADPGRPVGEFSTVVLNEGTPGMRWGDPWKGFGMRGNSSAALYLEDVVIPAKDLLGEEGDQIWYVFQVVAPYFLAATAGTYLGAAVAAFEETRSHLKHRSFGHTGESLGQSPVLQHQFGTLWSMLERTRRLAYFAGEEADSGGPDALPALCAAKAEVADGAIEIVNRAMTMVGGRGYSENGKLPRLLRDVRASAIMAPTTDILRTWTGRILLDQPILAD